MGARITNRCRTKSHKDLNQHLIIKLFKLCCNSSGSFELSRFNLRYKNIIVWLVLTISSWSKRILINDFYIAKNVRMNL